MDLKQEIIAVTGGNGFLGKHVCKILEQRGLVNHDTYTDPADCLPRTGQYTAPRSTNYDLTNPRDVSSFYQNNQTIVIHLAAVVGGIGANRKYPGTYYYKNLMMGALLLEHARISKLEKFVAVGTICAYPKYTPIPFQESDLWEGYPEETNAPYGIAKKAMLVQAQAYRQEFGMNNIYLLPVNLYGPGDNFNPETSHVIPALIKKCVEARNTGASEIECWGTGTATREFLYVEDAAEAIVLATEHYNKAEPINVGNGTEIRIADLVEKIARIVGFKGKIKWNSKYPDGQPRRCLDVTKAKQEFGFTAKTELDDGLTKTIEWYERNQQ